MFRYIFCLAVSAAVPIVFSPMFFATIPYGSFNMGVIKIGVAVALFLFLINVTKKA